MKRYYPFRRAESPEEETGNPFTIVKAKKFARVSQPENNLLELVLENDKTRLQLFYGIFTESLQRDFLREMGADNDEKRIVGKKVEGYENSGRVIWISPLNQSKEH
ncbi:MAG: hypothetical protein AABX10_04245 [Nanoarchaeota archaeon]